MTPQPPPASPPPKFDDLAGRSWTIRLDFATLKRIRTAAQVDLGDLTTLPALWGELLFDDLKALEVVWLAVQPTAEALDVSREAFEESMDGAALDAARKALEVAVINFSPSKRSVATTALREVQTGLQAAMAEAEERMAAEIRQSATKALAAFGSSPPGSPVS